MTLYSRTTLLSTIILLTLFSLTVFNISCILLHRPDLAWLDYDHESESLIETTRVPKIISSETTDLPTNVHVFQNDGQVSVGVNAPRHPIFDILENANEEWESLLAAHGGDVSIHTSSDLCFSNRLPQQAQAVLQRRLRRSGRNRPACKHQQKLL